jgi:HEAT repeat protein
MTQRLLLAVVTLATLLVSASAEATPPSKAELSRLLSGYEDVPPASAFGAWGPETLSVLVDLYQDTDQPPFVRIRAVSAAAHYPTPAARTFLLAVARAPRQSDLFIREAVVSLGRAFGPRAVDDVRPFLRHREPVVREGAVIALNRIHTPEALSALRTRLPDEHADHVRERIREAVAEHTR